MRLFAEKQIQRMQDKLKQSSKTLSNKGWMKTNVLDTPSIAVYTVTERTES